MRFSLSAICLALSSVARLAIAQAPPSAKVTQFTYSSNGCPSGSVSNTLSSNKTALYISFDSMSVFYGPSVPASYKTRNCQIRTSLSYTPGWTFAVTRSTYYGWAQLPQNFSQTFNSAYSFSLAEGSTSSAASSNWTLAGGGQVENPGVVYNQSAVVEPTIWAPCDGKGGASLMTNYRVRLTAARNDVDNPYVESEIENVLQVHLVWKQCP